MSSEKVSSTALWVFVVLATAGVAAVSVFYAIHFTTLSDDHKAWGEFGSFFGGVVTPILAFFSFIALMLTIYIQQKELTLTRCVMKESNTNNLFFSLVQKITEEQKNVNPPIFKYFHESGHAGTFERGDFGHDTNSSRQKFLDMMHEVLLENTSSTRAYNRLIISLLTIMHIEGILSEAKYKVIFQSLVPPNHILYVLIYCTKSSDLVKSKLVPEIFKANLAPTESELDNKAEKILLSQLRKLFVDDAGVMVWQGNLDKTP